MEGEFVTALRLQVQRRKGIIAELAAAVNEADAGIDNIKVDERNAQLSTVVVEDLPKLSVTFSPTSTVPGPYVCVGFTSVESSY